MIVCYRRCKGRITNWINRIVQADDNNDVELNPPPTSLFFDTSINKPVANLVVKSDQEETDEEDPYSNIGLPPTTMAPTVPIVQQPVTVSNPSPPPSPVPQTSSNVTMLSDDEKETDEEQGYMQPAQFSRDSSVDQTGADNNTPVPSSLNTPQLPKQVKKPQKVKKTLTDMSRRFSAKIHNKQKSADNKQQESMVKAIQKKKKDLEMQPISKPLTPVAQAVTDRLYDDEKISKGRAVKKSSSKSTLNTSRGRGRPKKKIPQLILVLSKKENKKIKNKKSLYHI